MYSKDHFKDVSFKSPAAAAADQRLHLTTNKIESTELYFGDVCSGTKFGVTYILSVCTLRRLQIKLPTCAIPIYAIAILKTDCV